MKSLSKKRPEEPKKGAPEWTTTFGDLMNLLLCFFVMLFAMSSIDAQKYDEIRDSFKNDNHSFLTGGLGILNNSDSGDEYSIIGDNASDNGVSDEEVSEVENLDESLETVQEQKQLYSEKMYDEMLDMLEEQELTSNTVSLTMDSEYNYIMLSLSGSLLFDSGAVELKQEAMPILSKIGDILLMYAGYQIEIEGHTDNVPVTSTNRSYKDNNELSSDRALSTFYYLVNEKGIDPATMKYSGRGEYDPIASNDTPEGRQQNRRVEIKIYNELSRY